MPVSICLPGQVNLTWEQDELDQDEPGLVQPNEHGQIEVVQLELDQVELGKVELDYVELGQFQLVEADRLKLD